jgi:IMP dehydrogenase/GMP reductase
MSKIITEQKYSYNDVTIVPAVISHIRHRSECNPYNNDNMLPLFTAPMDSVVGLTNYELYENENINTILPRTETIVARATTVKNGYWAAFSLTEFENIFCDSNDIITEYTDKLHVLIDVANGHMQCIFDLCKKAKEIYGSNIVLMVGNIANPQTYEEYAKIGVDYVRCSIGSGNCCLTSSNTAIHYGIASLISEIAQLKKHLLQFCGYKKVPNIVADGGIRNYSDVIKALALGADYVMVGSVFSRMLESSAEKKIRHGKVELKFPKERYKSIYRKNNQWYGDCTDEYIAELSTVLNKDISEIEKTRELGDIYAVIYGMASAYGQIAMNGSKTHTSEGTRKVVTVDYTMHGWCENMIDYLRSAMSYCDSKTLDEFREKTTLVVNTQNVYNSVNK